MRRVQHIAQLSCYVCLIASCPAQAADEGGHLIWSPISFIADRVLSRRTAFVRLSTANGTALTLTGNHILYVSKAAAGSPRVLTCVRDVKVRESSWAVLMLVC